MEDRLPDLIIYENYFKRLEDAFEFYGSTYDGMKWLFVLIPVLAVGAFFITWMYFKDSRSIRWYYALPLGLLRATVYGLLAYMFLLPTTRETKIWKPRTPPMLERHSRVVVLIDVSDSMGKQSDDPAARSNRQTRLQKLMETITDENLAFLKKLLDNNPVYFYRFASRLDKEVHAFNLKDATDDEGAVKKEIWQFTTRPNKDVKGITDEVPLMRWTKDDWRNFAEYTDFKTWLVRGLSADGVKSVQADIRDDTVGVDWAGSYLVDKPEVIVERIKDLSADDAARFRGNLEGMKERIETARTISQGTNVTESVQAAFEIEKENMLQGIFVFSDGRSNLGVDARGAGAKDDPRNNPALDNLHRAAKKEHIPIITVGIGEHRQIKLVRITDLQAPELTPPDDPFKIIIEADGENLKGETIDVFLEMFPPGSDTPIVLPGKVTFDQGEPPHGQFETTINPPEIVKMLDEDAQKKLPSLKELPEGIWKVRAYTAKINEDGKADPKLKVSSDLRQINIIKKSVRVLLMASVANRDFQYLLNQLIRDKADVSIILQNEAGMFLDNKSISFLDDKFRHLNKFPDRLKVEDDPAETPETKWLNLARYDVIIAFDPDWTLLTEEQAALIRTWVDLQAGGLLHVAGPINTEKLTYNENNSEEQKKLAPLLEVLPVSLGIYRLGRPRQERNVMRRLEFTGATPEMEFLRLDDDKPENPLSGWEPFFTGKETREQGMTAELKRGFYDYYPVKDVKAGATIVARYLEPQASENTFDKKDPPYIVTYKYGQGTTAFLGSSEIWRFNTFKDVYRERFWVKMMRYLSSGSRKKQNVRGRVLMAKEFYTGSRMRFTVQLLDPNLQPLPSTYKPKVILRPLELDPGSTATTGKNDTPKTPEVDMYKKWTLEIERNKIEFREIAKEGYFQFSRTLKAVELQDGRMIQIDEDRLDLESVQKLVKGAPQDFPPGIWRLEVPIPNSSEVLPMKFLIRKSLPPELVDVKPDMVSLAAISSDVDELKERLTSMKRQDLLEKLRDRAFSTPSLDGKRLAFHISDRETIQLLPETMKRDQQEISNPQVEPEIRLINIDPRWFNGPHLPKWMTSWYDRIMGQSEQSHNVAIWMLVCIALLSVEWLTRKLLKLA